MNGKLRGGAIATIFQDPMSSLNPVHRVGDQVVEAILAHRPVSRAAARAEALSLFRRVGIADPEQRLASYPHEMSGGMNQRVMIAMALANRPALLIADEPTTALDVTVQAQILELLLELQRETGTALIFITHSLSVVAEIADRVNVMYAGQVVEEGLVDEVFREPLHPYTRALLAASPDSAFASIPGVVPQPHAFPAGCRFAPRCPHAAPACTAAPVPLLQPRPDRQTRCIRWHERRLRGRLPHERGPNDAAAGRGAGGFESFATGGCSGGARMLQAVRAVDADVARGETVGVVGESGSGKSTLGRLLLGLTPPPKVSCASMGGGSTPCRALSCAARAGACRSCSRIPSAVSIRAGASARRLKTGSRSTPSLRRRNVRPG